MNKRDRIRFRSGKIAVHVHAQPCVNIQKILSVYINGSAHNQWRHYAYMALNGVMTPTNRVRNPIRTGRFTSKLR